MSAPTSTGERYLNAANAVPELFDLCDDLATVALTLAAHAERIAARAGHLARVGLETTQLTAVIAHVSIAMAALNKARDTAYALVDQAANANEAARRADLETLS